jgi:hypothetical protein
MAPLKIAKIFVERKYTKNKLSIPETTNRKSILFIITVSAGEARIVVKKMEPGVCSMVLGRTPPVTIDTNVME